MPGSHPRLSNLIGVGCKLGIRIFKAPQVFPKCQLRLRVTTKRKSLISSHSETIMNFLIEMDVGEGNKNEKSGTWGPLQAISSTSIYADLLCARHWTKNLLDYSWDRQSLSSQFSGGYKQPVPIVSVQGAKGAQRSFQLHMKKNQNLKGEEGEGEWEEMWIAIGQCYPIKYNTS